MQVQLTPARPVRIMKVLSSCAGFFTKPAFTHRTGVEHSHSNRASDLLLCPFKIKVILSIMPGEFRMTQCLFHDAAQERRGQSRDVVNLNGLLLSTR